MKQLYWRSILQRVEGRRIVGLWYGVADAYLRIELDDGSVLLVAASWEGCQLFIAAPGMNRSLLAGYRPANEDEHGERRTHP